MRRVMVGLATTLLLWGGVAVVTGPAAAGSPTTAAGPQLLPDPALVSIISAP
jgi:hypothetical protein